MKRNVGIWLRAAGIGCLLFSVSCAQEGPGSSGGNGGTTSTGNGGHDQHRPRRDDQHRQRGHDQHRQRGHDRHRPRRDNQHRQRGHDQHRPRRDDHRPRRDDQHRQRGHDRHCGHDRLRGSGRRRNDGRCRPRRHDGLGGHDGRCRHHGCWWHDRQPGPDGRAGSRERLLLGRDLQGNHHGQRQELPFHGVGFDLSEQRYRSQRDVQRGGEAGKKYTVNIEVRGVAGTRCYTGGTRASTAAAKEDDYNNWWYIGGQYAIRHRLVEHLRAPRQSVHR